MIVALQSLGSVITISTGPDAALRRYQRGTHPGSPGHFLIRAVRWYREHGITVDRVLTDNGAPYKSKAWRHVCRVAQLRHRFTRSLPPPDQLRGGTLDPHRAQ